MPTFDHKITPMLWFDGQAEDAAGQYVSIFPDSSHRRDQQACRTARRSSSSSRLPATASRRSTAVPSTRSRRRSRSSSTARPRRRSTTTGTCSAEGGDPEAQQCGWLTDRFGVSWQVVPRQLCEYMSDPDPEKAGRTMQAMLQMKKLDIEGLRRAHDGEE